MEDVVAEAPPKREPQLRSLTAIENVVNEYARKRAKTYKWGIKDDEFVILLSRKTKNLVFVQRGHPVKIVLKWPDVQPDMNTILDDTFSLIRRKELVDCWAVEPIGIIKSRSAENKKWRREKFGEIGEIIGELIPKKYIGVETVTVATVTKTIRHTPTGVVIEKSETVTTTKHGDGRELDVPTWLELSRLVRDAEALDDDGADDEVETPAREESPAGEAVAGHIPTSERAG
jgi:hypothetical protein